MCEKFNEMLRISYIAAIGVIILFWRFPDAAGEDCSTVTALVSTCSNFVLYGSPDPIPGSPCCTAMTSLNNLADSGVGNRRSVCRCLMDLIDTYSSNATAIATLPGFCGVSLGFVIDPNTDCDYVDQYAKLEGR
ncbi:hypothetical protein ACP275_06G111500 [Erythranthe tilingii]